MEALRTKIGRMIMAGCSGERLSPAERAIFKEHRFGGMILFRHNCAEPRQILALCRSFWETAVREPPFIAIDQEGGRVHRLPRPFTHFPAAATIGARRDPRLAYRAGHACAVELALAGINLNFAPVLDVNSNPANPVIGDRAFGADPEAVGVIALAWAKGLSAGGIVPCGKHFPGHGGTTVDSHLALPSIDKTSTELETVELPPFVAATRHGMDALMTAHVKFTAFDPREPATLSEPVVTGLLRHQLGYDGVVFSDDLEMKAISDHHSAGEAALLALRAGVDVLLYGHDLANAVEAADSLYAEAERSRAMRDLVAAACKRIAKLKRRRLKSFSGAAESELEQQLTRLRKTAIHGNL